MNITRVNSEYSKFCFTLTERLTTAREAYEYMLKLNTEQETCGEFDKLLSNLHEISKDKGIEIYVHSDLFPGREDVILELNVTITFDKNTELKDIDNELVLGSVLKEIKNHFNAYYMYRSEDIKSEVIKSYFRYNY